MTMGRKIYVANVGDSRGIAIKASGPNTDPTACIAIPLSRDHKPDDKDEAERIIANNGRIDSYRD